jgi:prepilin-type N-terminal cleavage/methylation domain-containing protein
VVASASHAPHASLAHNAHPHTARPAFTIVELLVVISIIALVMLATFPVLSAMKDGSREAAGYNTVAVAASAARQLATSRKAKFDPLTGGQPFAGTAALFTNTGDIRIVENDPELNPAPTEDRRGYQDVDGRDYIRIPQRVGIVGVARAGGTGLNGLRLLSPPFAIRFNQHGGIVAGGTSTANGAFNVYYSADGTTVAATDTRPNSYNPNASGNQNWNNSLGKYDLPFNRVESVVAVIVFEQDDNIDLTATGDGYIDDPAPILERGKIVFFSRYTGAPLRTDFE